MGTGKKSERIRLVLLPMILITPKKVFLVGAFLALALGTSANDVCQSKCSQQFKEKALDACIKGCDNYKAANNYDEIIGDQEKNDSLSLCQHSCEDSFVGIEDKDTKLTWCHQGCQNAAISPEVAVVKPKSLMELLLGGGDLFKGLEGNDDHRHGGLTISFEMPKMMAFDENQDDFGMMDGHMGHMFRRMNSQMNHMLSSMKSRMSSMMSTPPQFQDIPSLSGAGGKMYVMESGPGYHEEKTYDIGPNGKMTLIENDMIDRNNPLDEQSSNENEVEVFEPKPEHDIFHQIDQQFAKMIEAEEEEESRQTNPDLINIEPIFQTIDRKIKNVEGPRLPETGLRSRDLCYSHSQYMKWSDWASCLHFKLGVPRWVMTTSICMGIIFLLWLCLVIPSNAPKQRVKATTPDIVNNAKEIEAMTVVSDKKEKLAQDLPPSYDDVANLSVKLEPVHETKKEPDNVA